MTFRALLHPPRTTAAEPSDPNRNPRRTTGWSRLLPLGLAVLLLSCTQGDLLAQQAPPGYPADAGYGRSGYPPLQQDYPPPPPDYAQSAPNYAPSQPNYAPPQNYPQQAYPQQPNYPPQQEYQQPQQEYAPQPGYVQQQPYPSQQYPQQNQQPYADQPYPQQPEQQPQGLSPDQLDQLVAPIALDPDALLAQILAASTFPMQITEAARWRQSMGDAPPQVIADQANAQSWDPSVKALTAFPQVLDQMAQNLSWTTELGNAYYNQPQDVFDSVQSMRQRAQAAGNLQSTPQEAVTDDQGYIALAPPNPQIVYVPSYNPWTVYGAPVAPYPGFSLADTIGSLLNVGLQFGPGLVMSAFTAMPWGIFGWGLSWLGHCLFYDHEGWYPHSPYLHDWGLAHGGPRFAWGHPVYGRGYDRGYDRGFNRGYDHGGYARGGSYARPGFAETRGFGNNRGLAANRSFADARNGFASHPESRGYSGYGQQAYNRTPAFNARSGYSNEGAYRGYGSGLGFYGRAQQSYRSPSYSRSPQSGSFSRGYTNSFRSSAPSYRAYSGSSGYGRNGFSGASRGFSGYSSRSERSGSFSGGNHSSFGRSEHFSGGHSSFGGGHSSHGGGGGHGGHGGGGHHH
ncbi:MAG TPA: DUF3300 domain-containing protein [Acidobacteriaceae bacterium]|jgi:hypothetical protein|nr:DUF3300 domain-containing protein [Acidobacteriaceae bacterium]